MLSFLKEPKRIASEIEPSISTFQKALLAGNLLLSLTLIYEGKQIWLKQ